jgi:2-keto-4-pentenoate hydratase/2-oxohepta-3-ene-1,7-dioic acid hydratase in catechol pathway
LWNDETPSLCIGLRMTRADTGAVQYYANDLGVRLWVNDEQRHDINTRDMDRHIPELLAEVTNVLTLQPGDVVATGTHHFGLEPVQDGDTIRLQIDQLGPALVVKCSDPSGRSWER